MPEGIGGSSSSESLHPSACSRLPACLCCVLFHCFSWAPFDGPAPRHRLKYRSTRIAGTYDSPLFAPKNEFRNAPAMPLAAHRARSTRETAVCPSASRELAAPRVHNPRGTAPGCDISRIDLGDARSHPIGASRWSRPMSDQILGRAAVTASWRYLTVTVIGFQIRGEFVCDRGKILPLMPRSSRETTGDTMCHCYLL